MILANELIDRALQSNEVLSVFVAAVLSAVGWLVLRFFTGKPNVAWAFSHQHVFHLKKIDPALLAYTREIWVQNVGKDIAEDVEIIFPVKPPHYEVWPKRPYSEVDGADNTLVLKLDYLNAREHITISTFQTENAPTNNAPLDFIEIRWKGGVGKQVPMGPQQLFPKWVHFVVRSLISIGFFSTIYFLSRLF